MGFDFNMGRGLVHDAYRKGKTVSAFLEDLDPTSSYPAHEQHLDAFQRQLFRYDIRTAADHLNGRLPHTVERFFETDDHGDKAERAALFPEWMSRQYRSASRITPRNGVFTGNYSRGMNDFVHNTQRFPLQDAATSFTLHPPAVLNELRYQQLTPSLLNFLVARQRFITGDTFTSLYLSDSQANAAARLARVTEYSEIPTVRFDSSEHTIRVQKYGRRLQMSYEKMRRMTLDMVSWAIAYIAAKADSDKEAHAIDVIINGDGNSDTAATSTSGSTLDSAAGGDLTFKMYMDWRMLWSAPYASNVLIGKKTSIGKALRLNAGSANLAVAQGAPNVAQSGDVRLARNTLDGVVAVDNDTATANVLYGIDGNWSLEMVSETGADITETDRIISAQYEEIALTESVGFAIATLGQNRALAFTV